jgi:hypothetical protein
MNNPKPFVNFIIGVGDFEKVDQVSTGESTEVKLIATIVSYLY